MTKTSAYAIRIKSRRLISAFAFGTFAAVAVYGAYAAALEPELAQVPVGLFWILLFLVVHRYRVSLRRLPFWLLFAAIAFEMIFVTHQGFGLLANSRNGRQYDELSSAVRSNDVAAVNRILIHDTDPDFVSIPPPLCPSDQACYYESRQRPIDIAIASGYTAVAQALVAHGAIISPDDGDGLEAAAKRGDLPMAKFLVDHGVLVNARDGKSVALWNAVNANQADIVSLLLDAGANPNSWQYMADGSTAETALSLAQSTNSRQIVLLLRRAGAAE